MAAWQSAKTVTRPSMWFLDATACSALARAAHSVSYASWPQPMWVLWPFQEGPFFHTTAYPVAPFSSRDPSVKIVSPGRLARLASFVAASTSSMVVVASSGEAT